MIRSARIHDVPSLIRVLHDSIRSCSLDHQHREIKIQRLLENKNQENLLLLMHYNNCWVYELQHQVVGFILASDQGEVLMNYVAPDVQQRGIGKLLLNEVLHYYQQRQMKRIVLASTRTALPFYQKYGFQIQPQVIEPVLHIPLVRYLD
ncbi:GNAT family N-acetyltransferase [Acinetobacter indicus]|nr:GNAT family N-acetyltransferase [Acinetobacter indicus]